MKELLSEKRMKSIGLLVVLSFALFSTVVSARAFAEFELETFAGDDFEFPTDMDAPVLNVVFLAIGTDQDNGTWQGEALLAWYKALEDRGLFNDGVKSWHFPVIPGAPFFVKGFIRGGMKDDYAGKIPLDQGGAVFVKKASQFADAPELAVDGQPTIILVTPDYALHEVFRGEVSEEGVAAVVAAAAAYLPATD